MAKKLIQRELCVCSCWDGRHKETHDEETGETFWPCTVHKDCSDFEPDYAATRAAKAEYKQKEYDERREYEIRNRN